MVRKKVDENQQNVKVGATEHVLTSHGDKQAVLSYPVHHQQQQTQNQDGSHCAGYQPE